MSRHDLRPIAALIGSLSATVACGSSEPAGGAGWVLATSTSTAGQGGSAGSGGAGGSASGGAGGEAEFDEYYYGTVNVLSPDEGTVYQSNHTLIRRHVQPALGLVDEEVAWDDDPTEISHFVTHLVQVDETSTFQVTDEAMSYTGTIAYGAGLPFHWTDWTYDIVFSDGSGTLTGVAAKDGAGAFDTDKQFVDENAVLQVNIVEHADPITAASYAERLALPPPWSD